MCHTTWKAIGCQPGTHLSMYYESREVSGDLTNAFLDSAQVGASFIRAFFRVGEFGPSVNSYVR